MYPTIEAQILQLIFVILAIICPLFFAFRKGARILSTLDISNQIIRTVALNSLKYSFFIFLFVEILAYVYIFTGGSFHGGLIEIFTIPYLVLEYFLGLILGYGMSKLYKH